MYPPFSGVIIQVGTCSQPQCGANGHAILPETQVTSQEWAWPAQSYKKIALGTQNETGTFPQ